jgi:uncharacterized membrane protein
MVRRFLGYGCLGWALEVAFTSLSDLRSRRLRGQSYLWMLPIYGAGGMTLEALHQRMAARGVPRWGRSLAYMAMIYGIEYGSASLLDRLTGDVPWRYLRGLNLRGYVRIDYAPFWYACGWLFESAQAELRKLDRPARRTVRPRLSARGAGGAGERRPAAVVAPAPG